MHKQMGNKLIRPEKWRSDIMQAQFFRKINTHIHEWIFGDPHQNIDQDKVFDNGRHRKG